MWKGTSALKELDRGLQNLRGEVFKLDQELDAVTRELGVSERRRAQILREIAAVRLSALKGGDLDAVLNSADQQAQLSLAQRDQALSTLDAEIESINHALSALEVDRAEQLMAVNKQAQKLVDLEAKVQAELKLSSSYIAQLQQANSVESVAEEAAHKAEQASADFAEKAAPYQADDLFIYLWQQGFGTTEYQGGLLARFVDSWIARLISYEKARVNYWNIIEIPKRLAEHAERVGDQADVEHQQLQELEQQALFAAGHQEVQRHLDEMRASLDTLDDRLEASEQELNLALEQRARFLSGQDSYMQQALSALIAALEHQDVSSVLNYARQTLSRQDDKAVIELQGLESSLAAREENLRAAQSIHQSRFAKLQELERIRQQFKNARFDDLRSGFTNKALIASALSRFLEGVVTGSELWRLLQKNQRYRNVGSAPDFGSGGLGEIADILNDELLRAGRQRRHRRGSSWDWPRPRSGRGGGFKMPGSSGGGFKFPSGNGGFKTGGGF